MELRVLIRWMSTENPLWGAPRLHGELLKLGFVRGQLAENPAAGVKVRVRRALQDREKPSLLPKAASLPPVAATM
jgi:hypothetical protein